MFNRQRTRQIEEFANALAREIAERCPPDKTHEEDRLSMTLARAIDDACARAAAYQRERRLGMFGKAKFGTAFKYQLRESGYPDPLVDSMTRQLLFKMSVA